MNRLEEKYQKEIVPQLKEKFGTTNENAIPALEKVVLNAGLGKSLNDPSYAEAAMKVLAKISGQKPVETKAKKSISNFKIRQGMVVGAKVTLRGELMYAFIDKLINVTLPRVRDFRGVSKNSFDGQGNYSLGFKEHIVFPEIASDDVERLIGLEVNITTTADTDEEGRELLTLLGFPFEKKENK